MKLLIIESPGKRRKLSAILGPAWRIEATVGHVRDLPVRGLNVGDAPDYVPNYEVRPDRRDIVAKLAGMAGHAEVYVGTDPDREGEAIAWHIASCLRLKDIRRVRFDQLTEAAVLEAVATPSRLDLNLVRAQEARRVVDRLVGYLATSALTRRVGEVTPAGRVQSAAVRLVVERERAIGKFVPADFYVVRLHGGSLGRPWWLDLQVDGKALPGIGGVDEAGRLLDRARAERLASLQAVIVAESGDTVDDETPPPPLTTSSLQQAASVRLGFSPERTMEIAQKLYEGGHITYHRTDNPNLANDALEAIAAWATRKGVKCVPALRTFKVPASAQAGHRAIAPTHFEAMEAGEGTAESALYRLIWTRAVCSQLLPAKYRKRSLVATASDIGRKVTFGAWRRELMEAGWRALLPSAPEEDEKADDETGPEAVNHLPTARAGETLRIGRGEVVAKKTRAPERFTEASLIRKLEAEGIGRPATYAAIMRGIRDDAYVAVRKRKLWALARGEALVDLLVGRFGFVNLEFTREVEEGFDAVARGNEAYASVVGKVHGRLVEELARFEIGCPRCGQGLMCHRVKAVRDTGETRESWSCSRWREGCDAWFADKEGAPDFGRPIARRSRETRPCPLCGEGKAALVPAGTTRSGNPYAAFWSCAACHRTFDDCDGSPAAESREKHRCAGCSSWLRRVPAGVGRTTNKPYAAFWSCTSKTCGKSFADKEGVPVERSGHSRGTQASGGAGAATGEKA
jgi:DNA topoisomerase-1